MTRDSAFDAVRGYLLQKPFLFNTVRVLHQTCQSCAGVLDDAAWVRCRECDEYARTSATADVVGSMVYGIKNAQSGYIMHGYKRPTPSIEHHRVVSSLIRLGIYEHKRCADRIVGIEAKRWATVPSTQGRTNHPFRTILHELGLNNAELVVFPSPTVTSTRDIAPENYVLGGPVPERGHVMVLDDTWTSGGHAQSLSVALKRAGVGAVSILTVARWLNPAWGRGQEVVSNHITNRTYDPSLCPWTGGPCP
ncbi:hypothetical protein Y013_26465 (plasmid) [Rhodococcus pyridinivorans SB3094]|uniref:Amidophosphoribosyltransferase n=1 Tax=Rhodococcus pyridinivorans SB3094 TaxID=1435356 RepID=V9XSG6_9NOCA|nr:hypothetical protein [Rhodococcus pyridinivorans]AHD24342.1 hypothetical protein Y013_26465 [Rhodococcus pyridinivorans SB3094]